MQKLFTTSEAAELLGLSRRTLESFRQRGEGPPPVRLGRRAIRYRLEALEEWAGVSLRDDQRGVA